MGEWLFCLSRTAEAELVAAVFARTRRPRAKGAEGVVADGKEER